MNRPKRPTLFLGLLGMLIALGVFATQSAPVAADPMLRIVKSALGQHQGGPNDGAREYRLMARNQGDPLPPGSTVTIVDDFDNALEILAIHDVHPDWTCNLGPGNVLTCTLDPGAQLSDQDETIVLIDACDTIVRGSVSNDATIRLNGVVHDTDTANPNVFDCAPPTGPNLTLDKTGPASVPEGTSPAGSADYTIVVGNNGTAPTSGLVTVVDDLPNGLTAVTVSGTGWDCNPDPAQTTLTLAGPTSNTSFTCTRSDALANGQSYPPINVDFTAPNDNCDPITNRARVSGGGDTGLDPDAEDSVTTTVTGCVAGPNLTLDKTGPTSLPEGTASSYAIVVGNNGSAPTSGTVTVTDSLPNGLTGVTVSGTGWDCNPDAAQTTLTIAGPTNNTSFTCTRSDVLAVGATYPPINVSFTAPNNNCGSITNTARVSGGGDEGTDPDAQDSVTTDLICGSIEIIKDTNPEGSNETFDFSGDLGNFSLQDDGSELFPDLFSGTFAITEEVPSGWELTDIVCNAADFSVNNESVTIRLLPGENVVCTFTNEEQDKDKDKDEDRDKRLITPTATPTLTATPTSTPTVTPTLTFFEQRGPVGGAVVGVRPDRTPVAPQVVAPQPPSVIQPPRTGDAGLAADGSGWPVYVLSALAFAGGLAVVFVARQKAR